MDYSSSLFISIFVAFTFIPISTSIPFIVLHGIGNQCSHQDTTQFTEQLRNFSKSEGYCIEIGDGMRDSWFMPVEKQAEVVCEKVKEMKEMGKGYNIVALSQGNLIGRAVVEFCEGGPPVKKFISLGGPHAGTASVPLCGNIPGYLEKCRFLPKLNNEHPGERNSTYKGRLSSLENLVLIMFEHDTVLIPKETSWFGYYPDGAFKPVLLPKQYIAQAPHLGDWATI